jgi:hypothetical protein
VSVRMRGDGGTSLLSSLFLLALPFPPFFATHLSSSPASPPSLFPCLLVYSSFAHLLTSSDPCSQKTPDSVKAKSAPRPSRTRRQALPIRSDCVYRRRWKGGEGEEVISAYLHE